MARSQDIRSGIFREESAVHVSEATYRERVARAEPRQGDLFFSREGTYFGIAAEVPAGTRVCLGQRMVLIRPSVNRVNHRFLRYWLNSPVSSAHLHGFRDGTVAERLNLPTIRDLPVAVPPLAQQAAIARVLGTLDDKIELNRRMNETLEAMARALFKSWFVDFDPVRAKASGARSFPGMPRAVFNNFPSRFTASPQGLIPAGSRLVPVDDIAEVNAWTLRREDELDRIEYIEISEVMKGEVGAIAVYERGSEPSRARRRLRHGDTVISTVRPERGAYFLCLNPSRSLIASTGFAVLSPKGVPWSVVHAAMTRSEVFDHLGQLADGAAYPAVRPEVLGAWELVLPSDEETLSAFHATCGPLYERIEGNHRESRGLAAARDALLPKLLSGEVRVKDAERFVGAVT